MIRATSTSSEIDQALKTCVSCGNEVQRYVTFVMDMGEFNPVSVVFYYSKGIRIFISRFLFGKKESPLTHVLIEFGLDNKLFGHKIYNKTSFFLYLFDYV